MLAEHTVSLEHHGTVATDIEPAEQCEKLAAAIKATLQSAVKAGGSSLRDYVAADGELGYFQLHTKVYDRAGLPCKACGTPVKKLTRGQRSTFYCPSCQK